MVLVPSPQEFGMLVSSKDINWIRILGERVRVRGHGFSNVCPLTPSLSPEDGGEGDQDVGLVASAGALEQGRNSLDWSV